MEASHSPSAGFTRVSVLLFAGRSRCSACVSKCVCIQVRIYATTRLARTARCTLTLLYDGTWFRPSSLAFAWNVRFSLAREKTDQVVEAHNRVIVGWLLTSSSSDAAAVAPPWSHPCVFPSLLW